MASKDVPKWVKKYKEKINYEERLKLQKLNENTEEEIAKQLHFQLH